MDTKNIILIDLDAILDTRIGCLSQIDATETLSILQKGFLSRDSDDLTTYTSKITNEQFKQAYENRDVETLKLSKLTNVVQLICHETYNMHQRILNGQSPIDDFAVVLNLHPYQLTQEEEMGIKYALEQLLGEAIPIRITKLEPNSTQLSYLAMRGFTDYVTYDIKGWIERQFSHCEKIEDYVIEPDINIWGPKLLLQKDALDKVYAKFPDLTENDNPFNILQAIYAPYVGITWLDAQDFSLITPNPKYAA